jgi:arsenate reductase
MSQDFPVVIHHNPNCGTSRNVLELIRQSGREPQVNRYLDSGWTRAKLEQLLKAMGKRPRDILRTRGSPAEELGLLQEGVSDEAILAAMTEHPILVERPIVETPKGVRLCRPADLVRELL